MIAIKNKKKRKKRKKIEEVDKIENRENIPLKFDEKKEERCENKKNVRLENQISSNIEENQTSSNKEEKKTKRKIINLKMIDEMPVLGMNRKRLSQIYTTNNKNKLFFTLTNSK